MPAALHKRMLILVMASRRVLRHRCEFPVLTVVSVLPEVALFAVSADMHRLPVSVRPCSGSQQDQAG